MDILLQNVSIFSSGMLFHKIALITSKGCLFVEWVKSSNYHFDGAEQDQPPKYKHSSKVVVGRSCSEKVDKFHRQQPLGKTFLHKLQLARLEKKYHHRCFLMTFAKFRRIFLNSCFKEITNKRKPEWKGSQHRNFIGINSIGISSCGFIYSSVSRGLSSLGYKKWKCSLQEHDNIVKSKKLATQIWIFQLALSLF